MCPNCAGLARAIDAYLAKAENDLGDQLKAEGYADPKKTAKLVNKLEDDVAGALEEESQYISSQVEQSIDLQSFADDVWPVVKLDDPAKAKLTTIFRDAFTEAMPGFCQAYMRTLDKGLKITRLSNYTLGWIEDWSGQLANIMCLDSQTEIERILLTGMERGYGTGEVSRMIMDSGIRNPWYRARRTAITEVLTANRAAQQEAFMQSPSTSGKMWRHTGIYIRGPRPNHQDMDGAIVDKAEPFTLQGADGGTYYPSYPGDPVLPPGERIECHCVCVPIVDEAVLGLSLEEREELQQQALDELDDDWMAEIEERNKQLAGYTGD